MYIPKTDSVPSPESVVHLVLDPETVSQNLKERFYRKFGKAAFRASKRYIVVECIPTGESVEDRKRIGDTAWLRVKDTQGRVGTFPSRFFALWPRKNSKKKKGKKTKGRRKKR